MQAPADRDVDIVVAITTLGEHHAAERFALPLVERGLIACANVLPRITSYYRWKGETNVDDEQLVIMKLRRDRVDELKQVMKELHPYEVPELIVLDVVDGLPDYLEWVRESSA